MTIDYIALLVVGVLVIGGGLYLLREAKRYKARKSSQRIPR